MKSIVNKTRRPLRVSLPQGKVLHLGPSKTGQIADHAADFPAVRRLVEEGSIVIEEGAGSRAAGADSDAGHEATHGHHPPVTVHKSGDR